MCWVLAAGKLAEQQPYTETEVIGNVVCTETQPLAETEPGFANQDYQETQLIDEDLQCHVAGGFSGRGCAHPEATNEGNKGPARGSQAPETEAHHAICPQSQASCGDHSQKYDATVGPHQPQPEIPHLAFEGGKLDARTQERSAGKSMPAALHASQISRGKNMKEAAEPLPTPASATAVPSVTLATQTQVIQERVPLSAPHQASEAVDPSQIASLAVTPNDEDAEAVKSAVLPEEQPKQAEVGEEVPEGSGRQINSLLPLEAVQFTAAALSQGQPSACSLANQVMVPGRSSHPYCGPLHPSCR